MSEMAVYPTWYDKVRAEITAKHPWMQLHWRESYYDPAYDCDVIWVYPVVYGPEEYL